CRFRDGSAWQSGRASGRSAASSPRAGSVISSMARAASSRRTRSLAARDVHPDGGVWYSRGRRGREGRRRRVAAMAGISRVDLTVELRWIEKGGRVAVRVRNESGGDLLKTPGGDGLELDEREGFVPRS